MTRTFRGKTLDEMTNKELLELVDGLLADDQKYCDIVREWADVLRENDAIARALAIEAVKKQKVDRDI